ncbi:hypothetical protein M6B38_189975 [Iris pallida]|uniref:Uncharacterized protein n=1 Tax=Iris pallida TaxID=29817 RepID=A0AAX6EIZ6_IRIPA|nr:hypothetical protein M6B38_189975 [Iris pallida]
MIIHHLLQILFVSYNFYTIMSLGMDTCVNLCVWVCIPIYYLPNWFFSCWISF